MADMETRRERITNLVTVTLVTVLIWIWAAGETREEITSFSDLRFTGQTRDSVRISPEELMLQLFAQATDRHVAE